MIKILEAEKHHWRGLLDICAGIFGAEKASGCQFGKSWHHHCLFNFVCTVRLDHVYLLVFTHYY